MIDFKELGFVTVNTWRKYLGLRPLTQEEFDEEAELREKRLERYTKSRMRYAAKKRAERIR